MSFVQRLRMANMFPIKSDLGNARIDTGGDDIGQVIRAAKDLALWNRDVLRQPSGLQTVGNSVRGMPQQQPEGLKFGGVFDSGSNPGADILARAKQSGQNSGQPPTNEMIERPISTDEAHYSRYLDRKNKETIANAQAENASNKGWKTVTTVDPNDPSKQISVQVNDRTGETRPLDIPGTIVRPGSAKDIQTRKDAEALKATKRESIRNKAQTSLNLLNELLDPKTDKLTPEAARAVGKSSVGNWIPTTLGYSGSSKINKLSKSQILDLIGEMKSQSQTGATGFGNMSNKDLSILEGAASLLEKTGLDEETYRKELIRVKEVLNRALQDTPDSTMKPVSSHETTNTNGMKTPQAPEGFEYVRRPDNKGWTAIRKVGP